jgi:hypothetical protein
MASAFFGAVPLKVKRDRSAATGFLSLVFATQDKPQLYPVMRQSCGGDVSMALCRWVSNITVLATALALTGCGSALRPVPSLPPTRGQRPRQPIRELRRASGWRVQRRARRALHRFQLGPADRRRPGDPHPLGLLRLGRTARLDGLPRHLPHGNSDRRNQSREAGRMNVAELPQGPHR